MRRQITAELFASLDLVVEEPQNWHFPWVGARMLAEVAREQATSTLLLGRRTYSIFAGSWPERGHDVPLAANINAMRKVVISDHLADDEAIWGPATVLRPEGDLLGAIDRLDALGDDRVTVAGSVSLVEQLLAEGLLTELRLIIHPVVLGTGRKLFDGWGADRVELTHCESTHLDHGARVDVYRPRR